MGERPNVKMSLDIGRNFMLCEQVWFDTDMCRSSQGLTVPPNDSQSTEKIKYTLCRHALNAYIARTEAGQSPDEVLELLWFTYGFLPCQFTFNDISYRALVSIRGVCWVDRTPLSVTDPNSHNYPLLLEKLEGPRNNLRRIVNNP